MLKDIIKKKIEQLFHCRIYRYSLPRGVDFCYDARKYLPKDMQAIIFDVGANIGQSVLKYKNTWPKSRIYCFEPVINTYTNLLNNIRGLSDVQSYNMALGDRQGKMDISVQNDSSTNSFCLNSTNSNVETVEIRRLDLFCQDYNINRINLLKIDIEGFELQALCGANKMMQNQMVDFVYIETELRCSNNVFVPFSDIDRFMQQCEYDIFAVYDQEIDIRGKKDSLFFLNLAYIRRDLSKL